MWARLAASRGWSLPSRARRALSRARIWVGWSGTRRGCSGKDIGQSVGTEKGLSEKLAKTRVRRKKTATGPAPGRQRKRAKDLRQRSGAKNSSLLNPAAGPAFLGILFLPAPCRSGRPAGQATPAARFRRLEEWAGIGIV